MKPTYILKEVHILSENRKKDGLEFVVSEGDIILDKGYQFEVLPAKWDFTKPITRKKISNTPLKHSERLLRIKELGEDSAVVAILGQETNYEGEDTLVIKETEGLKTVKYGEEFSVLAKEQVCDSPFSITYEFIIADESKQQEQKVQKFCTECGAKLIKGDKFCRECGTPVLSKMYR
ncbi:MAG: zinc-ribbon domain-containing protein [Acutalibacteraceae bacterium]